MTIKQSIITKCIYHARLPRVCLHWNDTLKDMKRHNTEPSGPNITDLLNFGILLSRQKRYRAISLSV